jgi:hypothetical protein
MRCTAITLGLLISVLGDTCCADNLPEFILGGGTVALSTSVIVILK